MNNRRARELKKLAAQFEKVVPPGFLAHLERYAGDFMYKAEEMHHYVPGGFRVKEGILTRMWRVFKDSGGSRQRNMYRWLKRLYSRGQLPNKFRVVGDGR